MSWYLNDYLRMPLDYTRWHAENRAMDFVPAGDDAGYSDGNTLAARAQGVF